MFPLTAIVPAFHHATRVIVLGSDPVRLVDSDTQRAILYVTNSSDRDIYMWVGPASPESDPPHYIVNAGETERFTWSQDGPMATYPWYGSCPTGTRRVSIVEVTWHPEQLGQSMGGV